MYTVLAIFHLLFHTLEDSLCPFYFKGIYLLCLETNKNSRELRDDAFPNVRIFQTKDIGKMSMVLKTLFGNS